MTDPPPDYLGDHCEVTNVGDVLGVKSDLPDAVKDAVARAWGTYQFTLGCLQSNVVRRERQAILSFVRDAAGSSELNGIYVPDVFAEAPQAITMWDGFADVAIDELRRGRLTGVAEQRFTDSGTYQLMRLGQQCRMVLRPNGNSDVIALSVGETGAVLAASALTVGVVTELEPTGTLSARVQFRSTADGVRRDFEMKHHNGRVYLAPADEDPLLGPSFTDSAVCTDQQLRDYDDRAHAAQVEALRNSR